MDDSQRDEIYKGYLAATTSNPVVLYQYVARSYDLQDARYIKVHSHLCLYCDLFFEHGKRAWDNRNSKNVSDKSGIIDSRTSQTGRHIYPHWPKINQLVGAATHGCHVCQLFLSQMTEEEQDLLLNFEKTNSQHGTIQLFSPSRQPNGALYLRLQLSAPPEMLIPYTEKMVLDLTVEQTKDEKCNFDKAIEDKVDNLLESWEVAFAWITNCVVNHLACRNLRLKSQNRPRRLIAVGEHDEEVRLCDSSDLDSDALYLTLSHCWGPKGVPLKLQQENEFILSGRIPMREISKTFRDAVHFTRRLRILGVDYIWIDALCILQDSKEDWRQQASIMGEIYLNAFCNLAASTGPDGTSGLYPDDGRIRMSRRVCTIQAGIGSYLTGSFNIQSKDIMGSKARRNTIFSRGWCVQELALAPRILYFGRGHIGWDCSTLLAEDTAPTRPIASRDGHGFTNRKFKYWNLNSAETFGLTKTDAEGKYTTLPYYHAWMNIVNEYSRCDLTCHTDRLIAISGIARLIRAGIGQGEEYLAGLWKNYLPFHLLWDVSGSPRKNSQLRQYRAPSWSWASIETAGIYNHLTNAEAIAKSTIFIQAFAEVDLETDDPFGPVLGAVLHVQGPVFKAFLGPRGPGISSHLCQLFVNLDIDNCHVKNPECIAPVHSHLDIQYPGPEPVTIYCLLVMTASIPGTLAGLLLVLQDDSGIRGRYIRVGISYNLPSELLTRARGPWRLQEQEFEDELEGGDYKISII